MKNLLFIGLVLLFSCHSHDENDVNPPKLTISSPSAGAIFKNGNEVKITGLVTDESLHELSIQVQSKSDNSVLFKSTPEVHDKTSYDINEVWKPALAADTTLVYLAVEVYDHNDHKATDTLNFKIVK